MDEEKPREPEPKSQGEHPGKNAPEIKQPKEPEPEIKEAEDDDRFQATDN